MSTSYSKIFVDHEGDLSASQESVLFLGFLLLEADLLFEVGILYDLVQKQKQSSRPASQNSTSLIHNIALRGRNGTSTYMVLESYLPT